MFAMGSNSDIHLPEPAVSKKQEDGELEEDFSEEDSRDPVPDDMKAELHDHQLLMAAVKPFHKHHRKEDDQLAEAEDNDEETQFERKHQIIRKNDMFFHFLILCFALGSALVAHNDIFVAAGLGLLSFSLIEIVGLYFNLVGRIRIVFEYFLPLFERLRMPVPVALAKED
ncbi:transmembrane protein 40-like isoform X2 [Polyodon spathula]|uniref:transmembrane protein 40-like isoform X2 n=1 Tax=Polyodon spathula TaxID=7913 RepID=UPI001B7DC93D|nr:transmembrane protein 40-like isoform X2 [Polyodon spathula]